MNDVELFSRSVKVMRFEDDTRSERQIIAQVPHMYSDEDNAYGFVGRSWSIAPEGVKTPSVAHEPFTRNADGDIITFEEPAHPSTIVDSTPISSPQSLFVHEPTAHSKSLLQPMQIPIIIRQLTDFPMEGVQ